MIHIESYLGAPDSGFVPIGEAVSAPQDREYIYGAVELSVNGITVLDQQLWDLVDQLWAYITNVMEEFSCTGRGSTYFPDQPISLSLQRAGRRKVTISVEAVNLPRRSATTHIHELFEALCRQGEAFFSKMSELIPEDRALNDHALRRLRAALDWSRSQQG
jgi:hypothetical protein